MDYSNQIFEEIKTKYAVTIARNSLQDLALFLSGYESAINKNTDKPLFFDSRLQRFIVQKMDYTGHLHWPEILLRNRSNKEAFDLFYNMIDEFREWYKEDEYVQNSYWDDKPGHVDIPALALYFPREPLNISDNLERYEAMKEQHWEINDIYALKLTGEIARQRGLLNGYLLIQIVDYQKDQDIVIPIVYVKIAKQDCLPVLLRDYNQLEYIQTSYTRQEDSAWEVIYGTSDPTKLDDRLNQSFKTDSYGFLPEYRIRLLDPISEKSNLEWVKIGNYKKIRKPEKEYKPIYKNSIMIVTGDIFEERMIQRYCEHNLRELSIYHNEWIGRLY